MTGRMPTQKRVRRTRGAAAAAAAAAALLVGTMASAGTAAATGDSDGRSLTVDGHFVPASTFAPHGAGAVAYDPGLIPSGSWIQVQQKADDKGTTVTVKVKGLKPNYAFGLHVHEKACAADPEAAGKHYQHHKDPKQVNPDNEVWLDFTTDRSGAAEMSAHHSWGLPKGAANSVVLHHEQGGAGARAGCFTVPFGDFRGSDR